MLATTAVAASIAALLTRTNATFLSSRADLVASRNESWLSEVGLVYSWFSSLGVFCQLLLMLLFCILWIVVLSAMGVFSDYSLFQLRSKYFRTPTTSTISNNARII